MSLGYSSRAARVAVFGLAVALVLSPKPAAAAQPHPGDTCTNNVSGQFQWNLDPDASGGTDISRALFCEGGTLTQVMQLQANGNVGIGTTTPNALLDIGSAGATLGTLRLEGNTSGYVQIQPAAAAGSWTMTLPGAVPASNGYVLSSTTAGVTSWISNAGTASTALNGITAAAGNQAGIANAAYTIQWNWDTLAGGSALKLSSSSTAAASNAQKMFEIALSGTNGTSAQTTYGEYISNTHAGTTSTNVGLYATASGGTTANYAAIFAAGNVGIGTTTPNAGAALDLGANTNSLLLPVGTTGQEPGSPVAGMLRYNSTISNVEFYNGSTWTPFKPSGGPPGSGYFVFTKTTYTGNMGGLAGANANCLTDLTTNTGWFGYAQANAEGRLVAAKS